MQAIQSLFWPEGVLFLGLFLKWPTGSNQVSLGADTTPIGGPSHPDPTPDLSQESGPQLHYQASSFPYGPSFFHM